VKSAGITQIKSDAFKLYLQIPGNLERRLFIERKIWKDEPLSGLQRSLIQQHFNDISENNEEWSGQFFVDNAIKILSKVIVTEYRALKRKNCTFKNYNDYTSFQEAVIKKGQHILASLNSSLLLKLLRRYPKLTICTKHANSQIL